MKDRVRGSASQDPLRLEIGVPMQGAKMASRHICGDNGSSSAARRLSAIDSAMRSWKASPSAN
jgi:hypothetical protein